MKKKISVSPWGNSLGIRLPKTVTEKLGIKEGTQLTYEIRNGQIILCPSDTKIKKSSYVEEAIELLYMALPQNSDIEVKKKNSK